MFWVFLSKHPIITSKVPLTENELNADNNEPSQLLDIEGVEHPAQEAHRLKRVLSSGFFLVIFKIKGIS